MKHRFACVVRILGTIGLSACTSNAPPADVAVPANPSPAPTAQYQADVAKPMPDQSAQNGPPPPAFNDPAIVTQPLPEEANFVAAYRRVNQPRLAVFVNRTLNLKRIRYIGFDMDHTLVRYKSDKFEALAHRSMLEN